MPPTRCRVELPDGTQCLKVVRRIGMVCAKHRDALKESRDKYEEGSSEYEMYDQRWRAQLEFYKMKRESDKGKKKLCFGIDCSTQVAFSKQLCAKCAKKLREKAEKQKRDTGKVNPVIAARLDKQFEIELRLLERNFKNTLKCAVSDSSCSVRVGYKGELCARHRKELEKIVDADPDNEDLAAQLALQHKIVQTRRAREVNRPRPERECNHAGCSTIASFDGELCAKHRASLKKAYEHAKREYGVNSTEAKAYRKQVMQQMAFVARRKQQRIRQKKNKANSH